MVPILSDRNVQMSNVHALYSSKFIQRVVVAIVKVVKMVAIAPAMNSNEVINYLKK